MLNTTEKIKTVVEFIDSIYYKIRLDKGYNCIPEITVDDKICKYGLIVNNEFLYQYYNHHNKPVVRYHIRENLDLQKACQLMLDFYNIYETPEGYRTISNGIEAKIQRMAMYETPRYKKLKNTFRMHFPDKVCFKCGSRQNVEVEHIRPHYSFKYLDLAFDLDNLQWLCKLCNQEKGSKTEDYRSEMHMKILKLVIEKDMKGDSIVR